MNELQPLVTLITPTYNQAAYLEETIESVLNQDYPKIEYIVINDGSTDGTAHVLEKYADRITIINQTNIGQANTLNKGWSTAKGKYLSYLSSDDKLRPNAISELVAVLESDTNIACVFPDSDLIDEHAKVIKTNVCQPFSLTNLVIRQECHIGPGAVFRAAAFKKLGGWRPDLRLAPDREFWMRLAATGRFEFIRRALAEYRLHRESISYKEVSESVSLEYMHVLDDYFADKQVPLEILARKNEAYAYAQLLIARNLLRAGQIRKGLNRYQLARELHPPLAGLRTKLQLLRNIISKPLRALAARVKTLLH